MVPIKIIKDEISKYKHREDLILADIEFWEVAAKTDIHPAFKRELIEIEAKITALERVLKKLCILDN